MLIILYNSTMIQKKFKAKNCEKFSYMNVKIYININIYTCIFHPRYLITMISLGT